jgi:hypothetical protein
MLTIPKALQLKDWKSLTKEYETLDLEIWNSLDAMKKLALIRGINLSFPKDIIFGKDFVLNYPEDIYLYSITDKFILDIDTLNKIRKYVYSEKEVGGTILYSQKNKKDIYVKISFSGTDNRIDLNLKSDTHTLFHTHPNDFNTNNFSRNDFSSRDFSPPSILDILSYLAVTIKYIADIIIDLGNHIQHSTDDPLIIQNSMVVSNEAVYVYYISYPLIVSITRHLMNIYQKDANNFVYQVEKLLEEMELSYAKYLFPFNRNLNDRDLEEYLNTLSSLGILIKRFPYSEFPEMPEVYITL